MSRNANGGPDKNQHRGVVESSAPLETVASEPGRVHSHTSEVTGDELETIDTHLF